MKFLKKAISAMETVEEKITLLQHFNADYEIIGIYKIESVLYEKN